MFPNRNIRCNIYRCGECGATGHNVQRCPLALACGRNYVDANVLIPGDILVARLPFSTTDDFSSVQNFPNKITSTFLDPEDEASAANQEDFGQVNRKRLWSMWNNSLFIKEYIEKFLIPWSVRFVSTYPAHISLHQKNFLRLSNYHASSTRGNHRSYRLLTKEGVHRSSHVIQTKQQ